MWLRSTYLADFIALIFPDLCAACNKQLVKGEQVICTDCRYDLPYTNFHQQKDNIVARQFWGKLKIEQAYALLYFTKGGKVQNLIHRFKYNGEKQIGVLLGNMAGEQLRSINQTESIDYIISVPLHKSKLRKRGYNQSQLFADGLSQKLNVPVESDNLIRTKATETQTRKSRFSRFENMQQVFAVVDENKLANKHILLVDDIVTTGSTLEACGIELLKVPGLKLSIATIAYAE